MNEIDLNAYRKCIEDYDERPAKVIEVKFISLREKEKGDKFRFGSLSIACDRYFNPSEQFSGFERRFIKELMKYDKGGITIELYNDQVEDFNIELLALIKKYRDINKFPNES
jgi:hypothetical protein